MSNSPARQTVSLGPVKNSERGISREDLAQWSSTDASAAINVGGRSAEGTALVIFPPIVARVRTWGEAIEPAASASAGKCFTMSVLDRISLGDVAAPMRILSPFFSMPLSSSMFCSDMTSLALTKPCLMSTRRSVPPAMIRASLRSDRSLMASDMVRGE
ncbi:hypothetical protein ES703_34126 [subsurface metagenome]